MLYRWLGGIFEGGKAHQTPRPLVSVIIVDDRITKGVYLWYQGNTKRLPLLWAGCICKEIQGDVIYKLTVNNYYILTIVTLAETPELLA